MCDCFQGDGSEEVVACAWDGQTYIIDQNRTVVRFQFDENVNAFCAGETSLTHCVDMSPSIYDSYQFLVLVCQLNLSHF